MQRFRTVLAVIGGALVLVLATGHRPPATGHRPPATGQSFLLGKTNSANNITALTRTTSGSVMKLQSASSLNPPLTINGTGKVTNLNADAVDGYDSSVMVNKTYIYEADIAVAGTSHWARTTPDFPAGTYMVNVKGWMYGPTSGVPAYITCYIQGSGSIIEQFMRLDASGYYTLSISGAVVRATSGPISVACDGPTGSYITYAQDKLQVAVTRIGVTVNDSFATGKLRAPRTTGAR